MKNKHYIIALLLFVFITSFISQSNNDVILWNKNYMLTWNDFKGKEDIDKDNTIAMSAVGIEIDKFTFNKKIGTTKVVAVFECKNSWTNTKSNTAGLKHEQGHFDITEIYARKLRKRLNNKRFKKSNVSKELEMAYNEIEQAKNDYQSLYDKETEHHKNFAKQLEWNAKIERELQELDKYSNPEIIIKLK